MIQQQLQFLEKLNLVKGNIAKICKIYSCDADKIEVLAVSKQVESERIIAAIKTGQTHFGENYLQEAKQKWPEIRKQFPQVKLHFIGHLQSNKAKEAVELFDCIASLDSEKLAKILHSEMQKQSREIEILLQVNIGCEPQKHGLKPDEVKDFYNFCEKEVGLKIAGFMAIPPDNCEPSPYFALLSKIAYECFFGENILGLASAVEPVLKISGSTSSKVLPKVSMGMSADYEKAIALGATQIRLGSLLFGERIGNNSIKS